MKHRSIYLTLLLWSFLCIGNLWAYDCVIDGIYYNLNQEEGIAIVTYKSYRDGTPEYTGKVVIPNSVTYNGRSYNVTEIGDNAFSSQSVTSVEIPNSIVHIGNSAFSNTRISSVNIPNSVKTIGHGAFFLTDLSSVSIPSSVVKIGMQAFSSCYALNSVYITNGVVEIGDLAFNECKNLANISIPSSIETIGCRAFEDTKWFGNLRDGTIYIGNILYCYKGEVAGDGVITIKSGTKKISGEAFSGKSNLRKVIIPNSVIEIGKAAFSGCENLESVDIPKSISIISASLFSKCKSLKTISIPQSIVEIGNGAFNECSGLRSITIPGSVKRIGYAAFEFCYSLNSVIISEGVDTIGQYAFCDCPSLSNLIIPSSVRFLNTIVGRQNTIGDDVPMKISCLVEDPRRFGYNENGFFGHFYGYTPTMYIPIGRTDLYRYTYGRYHPEINYIETLFKGVDYHIPETGTNTLNAAQIIEKANKGKLYVMLQNHTTSANQYINEDGFVVDRNSVFGYTTWEVVKYGNGYVLKNHRGFYLKGTSRPAQLTADIKEATIYMPEDANANVENIAAGYNSSMAVRWKVLPEKDKWINTSASSYDITIQWNDGMGCWACIFTYEVKKERAIDVTYVLMEDGKEIDRQTKLQLSHSSVQLPDTWDQHLYDYTTDDNIGQYDCTIVVTRTHKTKVYEREFFRQSSVEAGKTYAIFNTAVNGTENRYGFYYAYSNWQLGCNPIKPSEFPNTDDYLWVAEDAGSELIAFKNKSNGNYINASQRTLGASTGWKIEEWTTSAAPKASVNSMNENEEIISNSDIKDSDRVFTVTNPDASGRARYWNGNDITGGNVSMPALWDRAHPFAFYSWQDVLYVFNTYILQECDGTEVERIIVKQKAFSPLAIPTEWTSNLDFTYTTSGTVGDDGSVIIVTRTSLTTVILDETVATELTDGMASSVVVKYTAKTGWNTFTMPFNMSSDDMTAIFGNGWRAYELKSFSNGELGFKTSTDLYAGHAYIVYSEEPGSTTLYKNNVNLIASPTFDSYNGATFYATYAPMPAGTMVGKYGITNDGHIAKGSASAKMMGYRGYIELPEGISDIRIMLPTGEVLTSLNTSTVDSQTSIIYDLQGRKLTNSKVSDSQMKGVFISNGKKVLR